MGTLRTILAFAVVFGHFYGFVFTGGMLAVQIFYLISGYLMSVILLSKNNYNEIKNFYLNRALRLYPIYWTVALIALISYLLLTVFDKNNFFDLYQEVGITGSLILIFSNIFLIGQDWIMFLGIKDNLIQFTGDFNDSDIEIWKGLLVPPAWTLGLEISFYLIAPFIIKNKIRWISLLVLSLILKIYMIYIGIGLKDPFSYRFFPAELSFFLLGVFSHQIIKPWYESFKLLRNTKLVNLVNFIVVFFSVIFFILPYDRLLTSFLLISCVVISLPFLAIFQRSNKFDDTIGSLSYPVYICHWYIIWLIKYISEILNISNQYLIGFMILLSTLLFAIFLEKFINLKVNEIRKKVRGSTK